jgi:DNA-binding transcriptional MerR regulator
VSLRQLQWWDERKVVSPRHEGHKRVYATEEVVEVTVIAELRRKGFSLQKIRRVLRFLQKEMGKRLSDVMSGEHDLHLVTDGKSIYLEDSSDKIVDILKNARQPMFLVCVSDQVRRLNGAAPQRKPAKQETGSHGPSRARHLEPHGFPNRNTRSPRPIRDESLDSSAISVGFVSIL